MAEETTRREFIALSGAVLAAASLGASQRPTSRLFAYVGRRTRGPGFGVGGGGGINVFSVNMADGALTAVSSTGADHDNLNCDGMCISADGRFLYAVIQTPAFGRPGGGGGVSAFALNREDGSLTHLNTLPSLGANPVGVIIDRHGALLVADDVGNTVWRVAPRQGAAALAP